MDFETIEYDAIDGVATITFNRPNSLNAFNDQMIAETIVALKETARDPAVRCIVLTGRGRAFSAGQDLKDVEAREQKISFGEHLRQGYNKLVLQIVQIEKPVIAAVNGVAAGAGCGIALAADIRIASHKASFIQAFSKVGLIPDSGSTWTLPRLVGYARAFEMAVTAKRVSAETALSWGLVNDVVPDEQLMDVVAAWSRSLAAGPALAIGLTKRAMHKAIGMSLPEALLYESQLQDIAGRTQDFNEGVRSFLEKRDPEFKG